MKSLVMTKIGDPKEKTMGELALHDFPMPVPGAEEVLIKVAYASICGSDIHFLKGEIGNLYDRIKSELPRQIGHEISGTIEQVGEKAKAHGFKVGDKVTADGYQYEVLASTGFRVLRVRVTPITPREDSAPTNE